METVPQRTVSCTFSTFLSVLFLRLQCHIEFVSTCEATAHRKLCSIQGNATKETKSNVIYLKAKHSRRTISSALEVILREDSASICANAAAVCFKCVDKINEYDDAFEKMQAKERELKTMLFVNLIPEHEDAADQITLPDDKLADAIKVDVIEI